MFYWLFTQGRAILSPLLCSLTCLGITFPVMMAFLLGVGIQRRADGTPLQTRGLMSVGRLLSFIVPSIGLITLYTTLIGGFAIARPTDRQTPLTGFLAFLVGAPTTINQYRVMILGFGLACMLFFLNVGIWQGIRNGGWLRERIDRLRRPTNRRGEMGSAHFCTRREYIRFRRQDDEGITFLGAFWGEEHIRLDVGWGKFCLSGEDVARGVLTLGAPGSGKTQGVILPVIADRMAAGHSLIVADPQGELTREVRRFATVTGHLVVVHDPTSLDGPRYNLAEGIDNIPAGSAIARVLIPGAEGDNRFWTDAAADLLTACLIRFDNLGQIKASLDDLQALAEKLSSQKDDAALAASAFIASVGADGKVASNVVATLGTSLTGWASAQVRANTSASDFGADLIVARPTVIVLTCPGAMRDVYAPYLGAALRKLMRDLDTIGERNHGPLPVPVGVILDEFPTLGKLDSLVADVNLVRKRRISILIAAQTKGQFHLIYGEEGTKALFTGLATQIVYGGGDYDTADFYSKASGMSTVDANPDPHKANLRQRALLTPDEIVNPQDGVCHIFSRFVQNNYAAQVILKAHLTRFYEREDWQERFAHPAYDEPTELQRGFSPTGGEKHSSAILDLQLSQPPSESQSIPSFETPNAVPLTPTDAPALYAVASNFEKQATERMEAIRTGALSQAGIATTSLDRQRARYRQKG